MFDGGPLSSYSFQREAFCDAIGEARDLLAQQWTEAGETGAGEFRLDEHRYVAMEMADMLRIITVRRHGALVGYGSFFIFSGMHAGGRAAILDALYLLPHARGPRISMRLVRAAEVVLARDGATLIHMLANERFPGFARLLERMGYHQVSRTLAKVVKNA